MKIDFNSIKLNFDVFTIAYRDNNTYTGLMKSTIKSQYTRVNRMKPPLERSDIRKYKNFCLMNQVLKRIVTQYEYDPSKGISDGGLSFKPKAMTDGYLVHALRTVFGSCRDSEIDRIKSAACDMRGIINTKTRECWDEFMGKKEAELKAISLKDFQQSLSKYLDLTFTDWGAVTNNFTNDREVTQLPKDNLYRRSESMRVVVAHDEWHGIMKSV